MSGRYWPSSATTMSGIAWQPTHSFAVMGSGEGVSACAIATRGAKSHADVATRAATRIGARVTRISSSLHRRGSRRPSDGGSKKKSARTGSDHAERTQDPHGPEDDEQRRPEECEQQQRRDRDRRDGEARIGYGGAGFGLVVSRLLDPGVQAPGTDRREPHAEREAERRRLPHDDEQGPDRQHHGGERQEPHLGACEPLRNYPVGHRRDLLACADRF